MNETRTLAKFVAEIGYGDLPVEVIGKAKEHILDQLGSQLACSILPWNKAVYEYTRDKKAQKEDSTVVKYGLKTSVEDAAFANATFGHGFELDDTDHVSVLHPGCVILPPALAAGEREKVSGKQLVTGIVVGYEVGMRVGAAARRAMRRWFHPTAVFGPFASAAATSKILQLDEDKVVNALGIAGSQCSGIMEYSESGGSVKRLHAGIAAHGGMRAAILAQRGLTGPATVLEGKKGFCQAFSDEYSLEEITRNLGHQYTILTMGIKPYACCGAHHAALDAISIIAAKRTLRQEEILRITVWGNRAGYNIAGAIVEPKDITGMQFSGRFGIALRIVKGGNGFGDYSEENRKDPEIRALIGKIDYQYDEELDTVSHESCPATVEVEWVDGTVLRERVIYNKGTIHNPVGNREILSKFRGLAGTVLSQDRVERIVETVDTLESLENVQDLTSLLSSVES